MDKRFFELDISNKFESLIVVDEDKIKSFNSKIPSKDDITKIFNDVVNA